MPIPFVMMDSAHLDHFNNMVQTNYVDFRDPSERAPIGRLVKGCATKYAIEFNNEVLISKPTRFRDFGENLIRDPGESHFSHEQVVSEVLNDPDRLAEAHRRDQAVNRAFELVGTDHRINTTSTRTTRTNTHGYTFGKNGWIFCASIEPITEREWEAWRSTLEGDYDHVTYIERPRDFARALADIVAEQLGPKGKIVPMKNTIEGGPELHTYHRAQTVFHGPVIYVDDPIATIESAESELELMFLHLFIKSEEYRDQREYRFAIWSETEPAEETVLLTASPALTSAVGQKSSAGEPQVMPATEYAGGENTIEESHQEDEDGHTIHPLLTSLIERVSADPDPIREWLRQELRKATEERLERFDTNILYDTFSDLPNTHSGIEALRHRSNEVRADRMRSMQQKIETASAAWYAERHILSIIASFEDAEFDVSISEDCYVVVVVSLHGYPDVTCLMAVAPTGECALNVTGSSGSSYTMVDSNVGEYVRLILGDMKAPSD